MISKYTQAGGKRKTLNKERIRDNILSLSFGIPGYPTSLTLRGLINAGIGSYLFIR